MFNTLKQILLEEIQTEVEEAKAMLDEIQSLEREIKDLSEPEKKYEYNFPIKNTLFMKNILVKNIRKNIKKEKLSILKICMPIWIGKNI